MPPLYFFSLRLNHKNRDVKVSFFSYRELATSFFHSSRRDVRSIRSIIDRRTQKDLVRGPTNHSRGSKGQSPERPTGARRLLIYRPLVGRTRRIYSSSPTSRQGRSSPLYTPLCPPVVRSFAPSTGGYDSSDRKRSLPPSPALVLLHNNETSNPVYHSVTCNPSLSKFTCK